MLFQRYLFFFITLLQNEFRFVCICSLYNNQFTFIVEDSLSNVGNHYGYGCAHNHILGHQHDPEIHDHHYNTNFSVQKCWVQYISSAKVFASRILFLCNRQKAFFCVRAKQH